MVSVTRLGDQYTVLPCAAPTQYVIECWAVGLGAALNV
jgi:hypothetical protein